MASLAYVAFNGPDGKTPEATATRYGLGREKLPDDTWRVMWPDGSAKIMPVDDMPPHWIEQLRRWNVFGSGL